MHPRFTAAAIHAVPVFLDPTGSRIGEALQDEGILCAEIDLTGSRRLASATFRNPDSPPSPAAAPLPQAGDGA